MKRWISAYKNPFEDQINYGLLNKTIDGNIVDYIVNTCKALEALPSIKFVDYEFTDMATDIDFSYYIAEKQRGKNKNAKHRYMHLSDSLLGEMVMHFNIDHNGESREVSKKILVPLADEDGYFLIDGTKYFLMYQITEKSTYTTKNQLVGKSTMPIQMKREIIDMAGYSIPIYTLYLFKKDINIIQLFLAHMGYKKTLEYFGVEKIMRATETIEDEEKYVYISISSKLHIEINSHFFHKFNYVRSIAAMLAKSGTNRLTMDKLLSIDHWITIIGSGTQNPNRFYDKGKSTLLYINRMLDKNTKDNLLVHPINKVDTYAYLRWAIINFEDLRAKNNMDLGTKRLRCNEYIAHLLATAFTERVNRIIALGSNATIENILEIFKFPGDVIIKSLHKSGLLKFDDRVNDMDFYTKLKVTFKGPSSLGGTHDRTVSVTQRGLDPSYLGRLDINRCGTSDPGMSAVLTPYCETFGLCFDDNREPEAGMYNFAKYQVKYMQEMTDGHHVLPDLTDETSYYNFIYHKDDGYKNSKVSRAFNSEAYHIIEFVEE